VNVETITSLPTAQAANRLHPNPRLAVLFHRFGPYHHARLNAAGEVMSVWGVEACANEDIYAWSKVEGAIAFPRVTLTDQYSDDRRWRQELQRKMRLALNDIKPHVVVIPGWIFADALSALDWCVETKTPAVVMSESTAWDEPRVFWKEWIKGRLVKMCAAALAGGSAHAEYLAQLGMTDDRIFPGYDVVDNDHFAAGAEERRTLGVESRKQLGLPERYFLASARFIEKKNLPSLIKAFAQYRKLAEKSEIGNRKSEIWDLVILGDGPLKSGLCHLISDLGLQHSVLLPGFKQYDELPAYFVLAGAFVHASTTEQWGLVVNEAMASSLPVLVSNRCGCARDLVRDGINGFTFDPGNTETLAGLMQKISASGFPLSTFGSESRRLIADWGPARFANGLKAAAAKAMNAGPPSIQLMDRLVLRALLRQRIG
jgi:glycosyltransferase involved in cell wall biosynthesis